jgi:hypothetical protein
MTGMILIVVFAILGLLFFLVRLVKGHSAEILTPADLRAQIRPVNLQTFRNLTNLDEEEFLQSRLKPGEFRSIQRDRLIAALEYVRCLANNAAVMIKMGETARQSPDASVAEAGQKLIDSAIRLRIYCFQISVKLYVAYIFPSSRTSSAQLVDGYERMARQGLLLGRMQNPARGISAAL